jgi:hypothetical protein
MDARLPFSSLALRFACRVMTAASNHVISKGQRFFNALCLKDSRSDNIHQGATVRKWT